MIGIAPLGNIDWMDMSLFHRVMNVNYFGAIDVTKQSLPLLKKCKGSRVINVSSAAGIVSSPAFGLYCGEFLLLLF